MTCHSPLNTALALSLLALAACERAPTDPASEPQAKTSGAPSLSVLAAGGTWTLRAPMPTPRQNLKAANVNGVIYAIGGNTYVPATGVYQIRGKVEAYNVASNTWTLKKALPEALIPNGATNIGGKIYVAGGLTNTGFSNRLYVYDPTTNVWTRKIDMPFTVGYRAGHQGTINGQLYVYAGMTVNPDGSQGPHQFLRYNPVTNTWATLVRPSYARQGGASGVINGRFYLLGGTLHGGRLGSAYDVHIYDPATGWTKKPFGQVKNLELAYAPLGGKLYVVGTDPNIDCTSSVSGVYDPVSNTGSHFHSPAPLRYGAAGAAAKGQFFVIGGDDWEPQDANGCSTAHPGITGEVRAYTP